MLGIVIAIEYIVAGIIGYLLYYLFEGRRERRKLKELRKKLKTLEEFIKTEGGE